MSEARNELSALVAEGDRLYEAEQEVLRLAAELKRAQRRRDAIANVEIPQLMEDIGIASIKTAAGAVIEIKQIIAVQPKKDDRPLVLQAVEKNGDGNLIKNTVTVSFKRDEHEDAKAFVERLQAEGKSVRQESKIEPSTLKKYVRDRLEAGENVEDIFGVRQVNQAVFKDGAPKPPIFEDE